MSGRLGEITTGAEASLKPGRYVDALSNTVWDSSGTAVSGSLQGKRLKRLPSYDVMWFAWAAFFPNTQVVA